MEATITKEQIHENVDRATLAYESVLRDPAYSSWPNAYREWILRVHSTYVAAQEYGLQEGMTYPPAPVPEPCAYKRAAYALIDIGALLLQSPTKKRLRQLDIAAMEANRLLVAHRQERQLTQFEVNEKEFDLACEYWPPRHPKVGAFPFLAVASEVHVAQRFGYRLKKRRRSRGTTALTFNQKRSKDYEAPDR